MAEPNIQQLRAAAKKAGINSFGMRKSELIAKVGHLVEEPAPAAHVNPPVSRETPTETRSVRSEERPAERADTGRRKRTPLGVPRQKLSYPSRAGYVRRWMNDHRNRIRDAQDAGYEFVLEEQDGRDVKVSQRVGVNEDGSPMVAYLMEIRQEFYDEDQAAKEAVNAQVDEQIMRRIEPEGTGQADRGRFYTPPEGRSMSSDVG